MIFKTVLGLDFNANIKGAEGIVGDITDKNVQDMLVKRSKEFGVNMMIGGSPCI